MPGVNETETEEDFILEGDTSVALDYGMEDI